MYPDDFLQKKLNERTTNGSLRSLKVVEGMTDLCSNDYLGMVRNRLLDEAGREMASGATGSRLISGNSALMESIEQEIAVFHDAASALLFNSGYDANLGLLSCVPQKGDTVFYDQLSHASIRDGIRLSFASAFSFAHNDLDDLEKKLAHASGNIFIVTESVFSMDGDICPLEALVSLSSRHNAHLILDEAHATGVVGEHGAGLAQQLGLQQKIFARVHTFGKACGCHGAVVLGSDALRSYLINFARSLVYTTALPEHAVAAIQKSYKLFPGMHAERRQLQALIDRFQSASIAFEKLPSRTPIQGVVVPGNSEATALAKKIQDHHLDVRPILYPTVPKGRERLRIVIHSFNTSNEIDNLIQLLQ